MSRVEELTQLLGKWEEENNANQDVTATLMKLAELFEIETEAFLKKDPDPFDDRHPSRLLPDCTFGHMLKTIFRNEQIVDEVVKVYCQRDVEPLNIAACRLLLDILPGLESVIFEEENFVPRLLIWADKAANPLKSYATGLLAAAMDVPDIAAKYREPNYKFVPLMLRRLHELSKQYLKEEVISFGKYDDMYLLSPNTEKHEKSAKRPRLNISPIKSSVYNESSNSSWSEMETNLIGSYQIYPLSLVAEQRFILQYLTPMGQYQDLLAVVIAEKALPLILRYIDKHQNPDARLSFEAMKYLASLLCHKKIALEFLQIGGLQLLLEVPQPSIAATGVSICLYYLSYIEEAMERIILLKNSEKIIEDLVRYALWLLECSHDSSRAHATMFFGFAFAIRVVLEQFDRQDGLRKLFNVMSTLDIFVLLDTRNLSDDQIFSNRQTTRHVCGALKRYFEAHLVANIEKKAANMRPLDNFKNSGKLSKAMDLSNENIENCMECWRNNSSPYQPLPPIDVFIRLDGVIFLIEMILSYFELSYSGRAETVKNALDILKVCSLTAATQLTFCEKISRQNEPEVTGVLVLLQAADGELMPVPDIQRSALHVIINLVCTKVPFIDVCLTYYIGKKKFNVSIEDLLAKLWKNIRIKNGIIILINLLSLKSPITDADSIRALACRALCGLARSENVKQLISKLPLITDGLLLDLMKEPVLQDKGRDHVQFCRFGLELLHKVTGAPLAVASGSEASVLNLNKSEIVAKTEIVYNQNQLLQLISNYLDSKGFDESASCLRKEISKKSKHITSSSSPLFPWVLNDTSSGKIELKSNRPTETHISSGLPFSQSVSSIPPPSTPLRLHVKRALKYDSFCHNTIKASPSRLQKSQTCTGDYVQTPTMKRLGLPNYLSPYGVSDSQSSITLDHIVTEYLRKQHALCKCPMMACPPFDLFVPHKCPEPKNKRKAPTNWVLRTQRKQICNRNRDFGAAAFDRKFVYNKFKLIRSFRDDEEKNEFACSSFLNFPTDKPNSKILIGTLPRVSEQGEIKSFSIYSGEEEWTRNSFIRGVGHIESSKFNPIIISSDHSRRGNTTLWRWASTMEELHNFVEVSHMEFGKQSADKAIGTKYGGSAIYDTVICSELQSFPNGDIGNNYYENRATFDYSDGLILSDGLIWDVKSGKMIHKLDKFNATFNALFHPNGREIISNTEIWDLRTFKLLRTVLGLDQCRVTFSPNGNIIYGVYVNRDGQIDEKSNCFYTFDAYDYSAIATMDVKRPVFHLSVDAYDRYIATIETSVPTNASDQFIPPMAGVDCVCRLYEIGRTKEEGDEDAEESDESGEESDDDDDEDDDDDDNNNGQNGDDEDDDDDLTFELDDDGSDSMDEDDATLFSLNTSLDD